MPDTSLYNLTIELMGNFEINTLCVDVVSNIFDFLGDNNTRDVIYAAFILFRKYPGKYGQIRIDDYGFIFFKFKCLLKFLQFSIPEISAKLCSENKLEYMLKPSTRFYNFPEKNTSPRYYTEKINHFSSDDEDYCYELDYYNENYSSRHETILKQYTECTNTFVDEDYRKGTSNLVVF